MREILFKAKREDNGEWVEGDLTKRKYEGGKDNGKVFEAHIVLDAYEQGNVLNFGYKGGLVSEVGHECFRVDPETVCQYTGLTDKNGRKIFEGDIINDIDYGIMKCIYLHGSFVWYKEDGFKIECMRYIPVIEVIGNIFDNPELIGEQP